MSYARPINLIPANSREGLANAIQRAINRIEGNDPQEALYILVDLLDDVASKSNPYRIGVLPARRKSSREAYRGDVNVD